jgi:hypothetical protein
MSAKDANKYLYKLVLQAIEDQGLQQDDVGGLDAHIFKAPGYQHHFDVDITKLNNLHKKWDNTRRLQLEGYHKELLAFGVNPGAGMQQELLEAKEAKEAAAAVTAAVGGDDDTTQGDSSDDDSIKIVSQTFQNLDLG